MPEDSKEELRQVALEAARMHMASMNAGIAFWRGWVETASKFAEETNRRLVELAEGEDPGAVLGAVTDASRAYLRELRELPEAVAQSFARDAEQQEGRGPNVRSAKVKD